MTDSAPVATAKAATPLAASTNCGTDQPFAIGARVDHKIWGGGQVLRYDEGKVTVVFDGAGYKTLAVSLVLQNELLRLAG